MIPLFTCAYSNSAHPSPPHRPGLRSRYYRGAPALNLPPPSRDRCSWAVPIDLIDRGETCAYFDLAVLSPWGREGRGGAHNMGYIYM